MTEVMTAKKKVLGKQSSAKKSAAATKVSTTMAAKETTERKVPSKADILELFVRTYASF